MSLSVLLPFVFIGLSLLVLFILITIRRAYNPVLKRVQILNGVDKGGQKRRKSEAIEKKKEQFQDSIENLLRRLSRFSKQDEEKRSRLQKSLIQAGYHREDYVKIFIGLKMVSAVAFFILYLYLGLAGDRSLFLVILLAALMTFLGYRFPDVFLILKIRKRKEQIAKALPDALDLLVISVEAGLGLNAAIQRVGVDLNMRCPSLSEELNRVNLGTSIADTLRAQADSLRTRIRQKAEEQAARAGIKLLFPLVMFILPALILILMGPGLISVLRTFQ